ncbi:MAG: hypothetical protein EBY26_00665 [Microbacteriaceae bacterium]|nr:hypothetical protein [Microbacteriaceae bacterium]
MNEVGFGRDSDLREFELSFRVSVPLSRVFVILGDVSQWPAERGPRMLVRKELDRVTLAFADMTRASVTFSSSGESTDIVVSHELCKNQQQVDDWRDFWFTLIDDLKKRLGV